MKTLGSLGLLAAFGAAALLSGCGGGSSYGSGGNPSGGVTYTVGGTVEGLDPGGGTASVTLKNNGGDATVVSANGIFAFPTGLAYLDSYTVTVGTQPTGRTCTVINGSGSVPFSNVTSVTVACTSITSAPQAGDVVITEVLADPAGAGSDNPKEWFEIVNTNVGTRDLGGVVITSGAGLFVVPAGTSIPSGAFFVFGESTDATANGGLPTVNVNYGSALTLANSSFTLSITVAGTPVDTVNLTGFTDGASLALSQSHMDPTANDSQANWCTSTTAYGTAGNKGTPGAANADCI